MNNEDNKKIEGQKDPSKRINWQLIGSIVVAAAGIFGQWASSKYNSQK